MRTKIVLAVSFLLLAALLVGCGSVALAQPAGAGSAQSDQANPRTMSVNGTGKVYLIPDIAYVSIGVHSEGKNASEVVSANNEQADKVKDSLKSAGVDVKDIQTTNFSIYPQPKYDANGQPTGEIVYIVDNTVYVTVRDIAEVGAILDAAVKSGANTIYGIQFDVSEKDEAISQAREEAVKNAQKVADELATAAGVTLGPVLNISSYSWVPVPLYDGKGGGAAVAEAINVPVSPGQMVLTVDVSMVYEIR
jgi:uncharacterized protein YggE